MGQAAFGGWAFNCVCGRFRQRRPALCPPRRSSPHAGTHAGLGPASFRILSPCPVNRSRFPGFSRQGRGRKTGGLSIIAGTSLGMTACAYGARTDGRSAGHGLSDTEQPADPGWSSDG